jgi:hypothetical protein
MSAVRILGVWFLGLRGGKGTGKWIVSRRLDKAFLVLSVCILIVVKFMESEGPKGILKS